jgi:hypothetical protein
VLIFELNLELMKKFLFFSFILFTSLFASAQSLSITSNDMMLCPGESATLTATADLPNRVLNFPRTANQAIILNNVPAQTIGTFSYEFWFNTPDSIVLLPEHVDGIGIYDGQSGQNYAVYPQSIYSGVQRRSSGISVGKNGISVIELSHQFSASRLTYAANLVGWHHCAVVYTSNNFELFIDGVSVGTRANGSNYANTPVNSGIPLTVAFRPNLGNFYPALGGVDADPNDGYLGQLDEFRVWKIALTAADVSAIYNRKLISANMQNVIVHMPFDMGTQANFSTITSSPAISVAAPGAGSGVTFPSAAIPQIGTFAGTTLPTAVYNSFITGYVWNDGTIGNTLVVSPTAASTTYTCTATAGTSNSSSTITITTSAPTASISTSNPLVFCADTSATLTANAGTAYLWSNGSTSPSIVVDSTGTYTVAVTNADNCIATSAGTSITVNPLPTPTITPLSATTFCEGDSVQLLSSMDAYFLWNTNETDSLITVQSAGDYTVTLTNGFNCSATSEPITVIVNPNPIATIVANGPIAFCLGNEVQLTSANDIPTWSTGSNDTTITVSQTEMIELLVTNEFGCTDTDSLGITVYDLPVVTAAADTSVCISNGPFALNGTPDLGTWTGVNVTDNSFAPTTEGTFGLQYSFTDGNGCTNLDSTYYTVAIPMQITAGSDVDVCMPSDAIDLAANASPAGGAWSGFGVTTEGTVIPILSGSYAYTYSFQDLCATSDTVFVNSYDAPAPPIIGGDLFICKNSPSLLWSNYVGGNVWSTSDVADTISIGDSGTYGVTHTDSNGCSSYSEVVVQLYPEPQVPFISGEPNAVYNNTYTYSVASLADYTYNWAVTGGTIISGQGTNAIEVVWDQFITGIGEVQITWANLSGCEISQTYTVNVDVSVQEIIATNLRIYPNPTRDVVNIQWDFMNDNTYLTVFDNAGKLLSTSKLNNQSLQQIDLSGYENGVYQLRLSNENAVIMKAIVVTR